MLKSIWWRIKNWFQRSDIPIFLEDVPSAEIKFVRSIFRGRAQLALYCLDGLGCHRLEMIIDGVCWEIRHQNFQVLILKDNRHLDKVGTNHRGRFYWEIGAGYLAVVWNAQGIKWVELGHYPSKKIVGINCRSDGFDPPIALKRKQEYLDPFTRFMNEIKPLGHRIARIERVDSMSP